MSKQLNGRTLLVTGGSRGLGRAMVERLVRDGARVLFTFVRDADGARGVAEATGATGIQADLSSLDGVRSLFEQVDAALDGAPLWGAVANAGIIQEQVFAEVTEADFDRVFDLNVKGVFFTLQAAAERITEGGRLVTLGTGLTRINRAGYVTYSAAKAALLSLTTVLAQDLGGRGITVNMVAPGAIDTDMNPWLRTADGQEVMKGMTALKDVGHAEDIANVVAFLASDDSRWVTAQRIEASGGQLL